MNTQNLELLKKEISALYIPYFEITNGFIKNFAEEKNIILTKK